MSEDDSDWSDSDSDLETGGEVETNVLLGVPDGAVATSSTDLADVAVSRLGGHPAFLSSNEPPFESARCRACESTMELLVQMWCPFEDSPMDRALYVWGCARKECQGKAGSVRAWRGLRYNEPYAAKLEQKKQHRAQELAKKQAAEEAAKQKAQSNPFSGKQTGAPGAFGAFGLGDQLFGNAAPPASKESSDVAPAEPEPVAPKPEQEDSSEDDSDDEGSSTESLVEALASTRISTSPWNSAPSYPAYYLSTTSEYAPSAKETAPLEAVETVTQPPVAGTGAGAGGDSWTAEAYENSMNVDQVFERFTRRVGWEGEQCVRYELAGTPLPFASDDIFSALFPVSSSTQKRQYVSHLPAALIPPCESCKAERVFECQMMPNLNNILRKKEALDEEQISSEERVERLKNTTGMGWGTCLVFSCPKDCCVEDGKEVKECWKEEIVLIQQDE